MVPLMQAPLSLDCPGHSVDEQKSKANSAHITTRKGIFVANLRIMLLDYVCLVKIFLHSPCLSLPFRVALLLLIVAAKLAKLGYVMLPVCFVALLLRLLSILSSSVLVILVGDHFVPLLRHSVPSLSPFTRCSASSDSRS